MTLDGNGFERAIVKHCSPALVGIKPTCLFNVPGDFAPHEGQETAHEQRASQLRNARLDALIARANRQLAGTSVHVHVLARRSCGALALVYRPQLLARELSAPHAAATMFSWGYETTGPGWLEAAITRLGRRLENRHRCSANGGFPHEVGLFLGYPYDDVMAFIEHEGATTCVAAAGRSTPTSRAPRPASRDTSAAQGIARRCLAAGPRSRSWQA